MTLRDWLIKEEKTIQFGLFSSDGTVVVYIDGVRYVYMTDAGYHDKWQRMKRYAPWRVLNDIKNTGTLLQKS